MTKIYERLSQIYDLDWGAFAPHYVPIIQRLLGERGITQARVLDLACGTGSLALVLAKHGHTVLGIDASPQMVEVASVKAANSSRVNFDVQDMVYFQVVGEFDLVTCTFDSVNYLLEPAQVSEMLKRVAAVLRPSGVFIFDSNTEATYISHHGDIYRRELGGESFVQALKYDRVAGEVTITFEFADGTEEVHRQRPYGLPELRRPLLEAGLHMMHAWSGFDMAPYRLDSQRLICVAEKVRSN
jgi:SAM-dependent methyltransferase